MWVKLPTCGSCRSLCETDSAAGETLTRGCASSTPVTVTMVSSSWVAYATAGSFCMRKHRTDVPKNVATSTCELTVLPMQVCVATATTWSETALALQFRCLSHKQTAVLEALPNEAAKTGKWTKQKLTRKPQARRPDTAFLPTADQRLNAQKPLFQHGCRPLFAQTIACRVESVGSS